MRSRNYQSVLIFVLGSILLVVAVYSFENQRIQSLTPENSSATLGSPTASAELRQVSAERINTISQIVHHGLDWEFALSTTEMAALEDSSDGIYLALRASGVERSSVWTGPGETGVQLAQGLELALGDLEPQEVLNIDAVELCISFNARSVVPGNLPSNIERGIVGLAVIYDGAKLAFAPTEMLAKNLSFDNTVERMANAFNTSIDDLITHGSFLVFDCEQILVFKDPDLGAIQMFRGNQIVPIESVTLESTAEFADLASSWLLRQIQADGRMIYRYFPSRGEESQANNMIRQWMATLAVDRIANYTGDPAIADLAKTNILYNLDHFYLEENGLGLIEYNGNVKLGAIALAALALAEHPDAADFSEEFSALSASVEELWREDGSFQTFVRPEDRIDQNQNYYPGEALLFWAELYQQEQEPHLLEMFMKSFAYYREWHRENRNPAFIPWHTQAYYNIWQLTGDEEIKDFIFEMNDWLLDFQEIDRALFEDTRGRFYDSNRSFYGPPHASSTGVYLEGLVDAYLLAGEVGDLQRQENYARAIRYGLRSLMQLQFSDEIDMYYVSQTDNVLGGLRTTVYDNSIRIDNVQHGLMAVLKILSNPETQTLFE